MFFSPDPVEQLVVSKDMRSFFDQHSQQFECLVTQVNLSALSPKDALVKVQNEGVETVDHT